MAFAMNLKNPLCLFRTKYYPGRSLCTRSEVEQWKASISGIPYSMCVSYIININSLMH
jgi:hypothetical protein